MIVENVATIMHLKNGDSYPCTTCMLAYVAGRWVLENDIGLIFFNQMLTPVPAAVPDEVLLLEPMDIFL